MTTTSLPIDRLTARELAIATRGIEDADETLAIAVGLAESVRATLGEQPGVSWAERRATGPLAPAILLSRAVTEEVAGVPVRRIDPLGPVRGTYLHLHGGGWCLGSHEGQDERLSRLADDTGMRVISVGYRLAPEHPHPAAVEDAVAVARSIVATGQGPFVIGGESAGAHLAALSLLWLRDDGSTPFAGAVLTYGSYDAAGSPSSGDTLRHAIDQSLPHWPVAERRDPRLSPLYANLDAMPAVRFLVGTRDFLVDDSLMLAARWQQVAPVELDIVAGAPHGFTLLDLAVTRTARAAEHAFIVRCAGAST